MASAGDGGSTGAATSPTVLEGKVIRITAKVTALTTSSEITVATVFESMIPSERIPQIRVAVSKARFYRRCEINACALCH